MSDKVIFRSEPVLYADRPNKNKRIYPMRLAERLCMELQPMVREHTLFCTLDNPTTVDVPLGRVCGLVTKLEMDGPVMKADIEITNTPCGQIVHKLIDSKMPIAFRTFGAGGVHMEDDGMWHVDNDYKLLGVALLSASEAS
jgi:hypothetical protein